jgi:methionyl-tRNA formyltransferase
MKILFFGTTSDSIIVLEALVSAGHKIVGVVTQPAKPVGRNKIVTPTPVTLFAQKQNLPILTFSQNPKKSWLFENENEVITKLINLQYELVVSASFGQKIPNQIINKTHFGGINIHPSLLPRFRGADPIPWAILSGDRETGVTLVTISEKFDQGKILDQKTRVLKKTDLPDPVRTELFQTGSERLVKLISNPAKISGGKAIKPAIEPYAYRFTREDGFIPWEIIRNCIDQKLKSPDLDNFQNLPLSLKLTKIKKISLTDIPLIIERMIRALSPWPGVWTVPDVRYQMSDIRKSQKRLKVIRAHRESGKLILDSVQMEGKKPVAFKEFEKAYLGN